MESNPINNGRSEEPSSSASSESPQDNGRKLLELGKVSVSEPASSRKKYANDAEKLISKLEDVANCVDEETRQTPLHHAITLGKIKIVELLLERNANPQAEDEDGWTPLKISASRGNVEILKVILDKLKRIEWNNSNKHKEEFDHNYKLKQQRNVNDLNQSLQEAAKKKSGTCVEELLKAGAKLDINAVLQVSNCVKLLMEKFDSYVKPTNVDPSEHFFRIVFDYAELASNNRQMEAIEHILNAKHDRRDELILHPLIESFIFLKWSKKICYLVYYVYIYLYLVWNCLFTAYMVTSLLPENGTNIDEMHGHVTNSSTVNQQIYIVANTYLLCTCRVLLIPFLIKETVQLAVTRFTYFQRLERTSEFIVLAFVAILLYIAIPLVQQGSIILHPLVFVLLLRWIRLTIMCGTVGRLFGTYSLMFCVVCKHLFKLLLAFTFLFVGFASAFYFIFHNRQSVKDAGIIVLIINAMINALDYEEYFHGDNKATTLPVTAHVIYALFIVLICLVLLNLFIALAVNDTKNLEKKGRAYQLHRQAMVVIAYEHAFSSIHSWVHRAPKIQNVVSKFPQWMDYDTKKIKVDGNRQIYKLKEKTIPNTNRDVNETAEQQLIEVNVQNPSTNRDVNETAEQPLIEEKPQIKKEKRYERTNYYLPKDVFERALFKSNTD